MWKKRILAFLLCLCMVIPSELATVLAEEPVESEVIEDTTMTEIPECECNTTDTAIYNHADGCMLKTYCKNLVNIAESVDALYVEYQKLPEKGQQCVLDYLQAVNYYGHPRDGWYTKLQQLVQGGTEEDVCNICNNQGCTTEHKFCNVCEDYDCGILHDAEVPTIYDTILDSEGNEQIVTVSADEFPIGVKLNVESADVSEQLASYGIGSSKQVFGLDISVLNADGSEWQPGESGVLVKIPVYATEGTKIGILHTHKGNTEYIGYAEILSDGTIELWTDGFSEFAGFTVDFHYNGIGFSIDGMTSILLSELFSEMGIAEDATQAVSVEFSDTTLVNVTQEGNDWRLTSLKAFSTNELLSIIFADGHGIVIDVTDAYTEDILNGAGSVRSATTPSNNSTFILYNATAPKTNEVKVGDSDSAKVYSNLVSNTTLGMYGQTNHWFYVYCNSNAKVWMYENEANTNSCAIRGSSLSDDVFYIDRISTAILDATQVKIIQEDYLSTEYETRTVKVWINGVEQTSLQRSVYFPVNEYFSSEQTRTQILVTAKSGYRYKSHTYDDGSNTYKVNLVSLHTVTWKNWDGTTLETDTNVEYGVTPSYNGTTPTRVTGEGYSYSFSGWSPGVSTVTGDVTYTAQYSSIPISYSVAFNGNDSTNGSMSNQSFVYGTTQNLTANAFSRSYAITYNTNGGSCSTSGDTATATFNGWATSATGTKVYNDKQSVSNLTDTAGETVNLYANWALGSVTLPTSTKTGYTFGGWYTDSALTSKAGDAGASYTPTTDVILYAKWTVNNYTISYTLHGGTVNPENPTSYNVESDTFTLNNPTKANYTFAGWTGTGLSAATKIVTIEKGSTGNRTYTANWELNAYTVTGIIDNGGDVTNSSQTVGYGQDSEVMIFTAATGYKISGITVNGSAASFTEGATTYTYPAVTITGNIEVKVTTTPIAYKLTYDSNGGSVVSGQDYNITTYLTLEKAPTKVGYTFNGWKPGSAVGSWTEASYTAGQNVGTGQYGNVTLVAQWTQTEHTATAVAGTGISETAGSGKFHYNDSVIFSATVKAGYAFDGWYSGDTKLSSDASYSFTMPDASVSYTAKAAPVTYTITYGGLEGAEASGNPTNYTVESDAISLKEPTKTGYTFTGWSGTGLTGESNKNVTIPKGSTENRTYTAHWHINSYTVSGSIDRGTVNDKTDSAASPYTQTVTYGASGEEMIFKPAIGYEIASITIDGVTQSVTDDDKASFTYTPTNVVKNMQIAVTTVPKEYTITWNLKYPDGTVKTHVTQEEVPFGSTITTPAVNITNYNFSNDWQLTSPAAGIVPATMPNNDLVIQGSLTFNGGSLTITKSGMEARKSAEFHIVGKDGNTSGINVTVTVEAKADGSGDITINYLPEGTYIVTEKAWSWEYELATGISPSQDVVITTAHIEDNPAKVSFTNQKKSTTHWLAGEFRVNNKFGCKLNSGTN